MTDAEVRLATILSGHASLAIAVSGGVDSMTLASFAQKHMPGQVSMIYAVSPAVPAAATARVLLQAKSDGWNLTVTDAGEFDDPRYRENPVNRCYFCKSNLYERIHTLTASRIASGANLDDLGDYRPGLLAAAERNVVHPFIDAKMAKADVRAMAHGLRLEVAELPAQPCLASRVETGLRVEAADVSFVEACEQRLNSLLPQPGTMRCRITRSGVLLELGEDTIAGAHALEAEMALLCNAAGRVFSGTRPYRRGAMFVRN